MSDRTPAWIVDEDPGGGARQVAPDRRVVDTPPAGPAFDLRADRLVWPTVVRDAAQCCAVLEAVGRGVAVVVRIEGIPASLAAEFREDLARAADLQAGETSPADELSDDQRRLLGALGRGLTLAAAAREVGLSTRTATRRLAEARRILRVQTNAEAVVVVCRDG